MTLASGTFPITPGSGGSTAKHTAGAKEHQVVMVADDSGHIQGSLPTYFYCTPPSVVGANKLHMDFFNAAGSGKVVDVRGLWFIPKTDVAVVGAVAMRMDIYRTSAVGTGGTAGVYDSATPDVAGGNFTKFDENNAAIPAQITARLIPTGGATIQQWLFPNFIATEETATSMAYMTQFMNAIPMFTYGQKLTCREGQGLLFKQGAVASVGSITILMAFTLE